MRDASPLSEIMNARRAQVEGLLAERNPAFDRKLRDWFIHRENSYMGELVPWNGEEFADVFSENLRERAVAIATAYKEVLPQTRPVKSLQLFDDAARGHSEELFRELAVDYRARVARFFKDWRNGWSGDITERHINDAERVLKGRMAALLSPFPQPPKEAAVSKSNAPIRDGIDRSREEMRDRSRIEYAASANARALADHLGPHLRSDAKPESKGRKMLWAVLGTIGATALALFVAIAIQRHNERGIFARQLSVFLDGYHSEFGVWSDIMPAPDRYDAKALDSSAKLLRNYHDSLYRAHETWSARVSKYWGDSVSRAFDKAYAASDDAFAYLDSVYNMSRGITRHQQPRPNDTIRPVPVMLGFKAQSKTSTAFDALRPQIDYFRAKADTIVYKP
jgi:hypothetical protein